MSQRRHVPSVTNAVDLGANTAFATALAIAEKRAGHRAGPTESLRQLGDPNKAGIDGKDHILIDTDHKAATMLGRALHNSSAAFPFVHSHAGKFPTVNNFWEWVRSTNRNHQLRVANPAQLRNLVRNAGDTTRGFTPNFKILIIDAIWQRIVKATYSGQKVLLQEFARSELPFEMYRQIRTDGGIIRERSGANVWLLKGIEELRKIAKAGYDEPTLVPYLEANSKALLWGFFDDRNQNLYSAIETAPTVKKEVAPAPDAREDNPLIRPIEIGGSSYLRSGQSYDHFQGYPTVELVMNAATKEWVFFDPVGQQLFRGEKGATGLRPTTRVLPEQPAVEENVVVATATAEPEAPQADVEADLEAQEVSSAVAQDTTEDATATDETGEVISDEVVKSVSLTQVGNETYPSFEGYPELSLMQNEETSVYYFMDATGVIYNARFDEASGMQVPDGVSEEFWVAE